MRHYLIALSAVAIVAGAPLAARDFTVNHADLNLQTEKGQKELARRIDQAAREYCGAENVTGSRVRAPAVAQCYNDARTAARAQMAELTQRAQLGG